MASWKDIRVLSKKDMDKRIARFAKLSGSDGGLPDSPLPECKRTLYAVIGFQPPKKANGATTSPVGDNAAMMPAIAIAEGFNLGYAKAKPGCGPLMHNHDTNETFIPMTGIWRCEWNEGKKKLHADLKPYDVISFPPGVARRFMNVTKGDPKKEHLLMFVIGGNQPRAEFTPLAMQRCQEFAQEQAAKKPVAKKAAVKRAASKKPAAKQVTAKKAPAKKAAAKKTTGRKTTAR
ncbi:MAG: cupin domain-containing protein [Alphaproteobacteria bacterium]|nr:cupin domain-containing protein [Alphaproteobacteria bacterium]